MLGERHDQARPYEHGGGLREPSTRIELVTLRLLSACSANWAIEAHFSVSATEISTMGVVNVKVKLKIVPPPGIAPGLPAPQAGVLLLYYSGWRVEDPGIDPGSQPCEGCMLPCTTIPQMCVHRDSNPNLNLGRVEYYPCTMNALCCLVAPVSIRPGQSLATNKKKRDISRIRTDEGRAH